MRNSASFHRWNHQAPQAERHLVFPDGCRDVLVITQADGSVHTTLTPFDFRPRVADLPADTKLAGYRLRPGAVLSADALQAVSASPGRVESIVADECGDWSDLDEAIMALTLPAATVAGVSRAAGLSIRTMQRCFLARGLPPPDYWRLLARARRAVGLLTSSAPLAAVASESGYSDQAHLTRALTRWFGATPAQLRRQTSTLHTLCQPALGNWTGEQISTR